MTPQPTTPILTGEGSVMISGLDRFLFKGLVKGFGREAGSKGSGSTIAERDLAGPDLEHGNAFRAGLVELRVVVEDELLKRLRKHGQTVEVMVSVAFDTGIAEGRLDMEVLEEGDGSDIPQVFAAHEEVGTGVTIDFFDQAAVGEAFEDAFAIFVAGSPVATGEGLAENFGAGIGFVDDDRRGGASVGKFANIVRLQGGGTGEGLLDEEDVFEKIFQIGAIGGFLPESGKMVPPGKLFISIEGELVSVGAETGEEGGEDFEALKVVLAVAIDLHLELIEAIGLDGGFERLREGIRNAVLGCNLALGKGVPEAEGVARGNRGEGFRG